MSRVAAFAVVVALTLLLAPGDRPQAQTPSAPAVDAAAPLFDDTRVEDIRLLINSKDWEALKTAYKANTYYPADVRWRDTTTRNVGIRSRGNGSRSGVKPGLRVDFDRYSTHQKFLGLKSVVLRNNTQDPSNVRERLAMAFFARMGFAAPREAHVRLFVNNTYAGLYTIVEAIDRAFLTRTLGEDEGYLFAYDYPSDAAPYYFEYRGNEVEKYVPLPFRPETHESDPHPEVIERLVYTINSAEASQFRTAIEEFVDVRAFVRFVAVETFQAEQDGFLGEWGMNNYYMYRAADRRQFTIFPWDKSQAFYFSAGSYSIWHNVQDTPDAARNRLISRLLSSPDLRTLYLDTLLEAARVASEWMEPELNREVAQIREAVLADTTKPYTNAEFEQAIDFLRTFARERPAAVIAEVARSR